MTKPTGVHTLIRRTHEERVLRALREHGALTRAEISRHVGLSRTTLSDITGDLLTRGAILVATPDPVRKGRGRPAEALVIDPRAGQFIGIDFGHRRVRVVVANASHEILASVVGAYGTDSDWPERTANAFELLDRVGSETGIHFNAVQGVGIGFPGPFSPRLPRQSAEPSSHAHRTGADLVRAAFVKRFGVVVTIDNNTRFAALAEAMWDPSADVRNLLYVRLSDGIGGGLVVGGRLVTGAAGFAGELGHISVDPHGTECRCGKRGCLETVASTEAIFAKCERAGARISSLEELEVAVAKGDPIVTGVLREVGSALGRVLGSIAVALDPSEIVIGGQILAFADVILEQTKATITYELLPVSESAPVIRRAQLGDEGGAIGAIDALFRNSPLLASYPVVSHESSATPTRSQRSSS